MTTSITKMVECWILKRYSMISSTAVNLNKEEEIDAEIALGKADITVNKNMVPFDDKSPFVTSGIRVGTPAITTRGLKEDDMVSVVNFIDEAIQNADNDEALHDIADRVAEMMSSRRLFVM
mgnify:CR=1 FL=1